MGQRVRNKIDYEEVDSTYHFSPLDYINEGGSLREAGFFCRPFDKHTLYEAFIAYLEYMDDKFHVHTTYNKSGVPNSVALSVPLQMENFWLFSGLNRLIWDELKGDPDNIAICTLIEDAVTAQQTEGAIIGRYTAKMVQVIQGRVEKTEQVVKLEPIVGMEVK